MKLKGYGYDAIWWEGDVAVIGETYDGMVLEPCGNRNGLPVYDPYDVDAIPEVYGAW